MHHLNGGFIDQREECSEFGHLHNRRCRSFSSRHILPVHQVDERIVVASTEMTVDKAGQLSNMCFGGAGRLLHLYPGFTLAPG